MNWKAIAIIWTLIDLLTIPLKVSPSKAKENIKAWTKALTPRGK